MAKKSKKKTVTNEEKKVNARLYCRVSTDRQAEEGYSLDIQKERLEGYVKSLFGADIAYEVVTDDGYSGGNLDRPGIQRIIREAEAGEITHVVVMKLDRLSRSQRDTLYLIEEVLQRNNVSFVSMQENLDTSTSIGRTIVGVMSAFAQYEREAIFERTSSGRNKRVEQGFWPGGGNIPRGYDYDPEKGFLVPNGDADKVRYLFRAYVAGMSLQVIADQLGWQYEKSAYNVLTNKVYLGIITYNDAEYRGKHEPLISQELFDLANSIRMERAAKKLVSKTEHLLTGLCFCGQCGAKLRYINWGKDSDGRTKYKLMCYSQQRSKQYLVHDENCDQEKVRAEEVEDHVKQALFAAAAKDKLSQTQQSLQGGVVELLTAGVEQQKKKLSRLYKLYADGEDDTLLETIEEEKRELAHKEKLLEDEVAKGKLIATANYSYERLEGIEDVWDLMSIEEQRAVINSVIENITIRGDLVEIRFKYTMNSEQMTDSHLPEVHPDDRRRDSAIPA